MNFLKSSSILIIGCIFIISTSLSTFLLGNILDNKSKPFLEGVQFGTFYYTIEQDNNCSGTLTVSIEDTGDNTIAISLLGDVLARLWGLTIPAHLDAKMYVNSLGQLTASVAQIESLENRIVFGTTFINPMVLTIKYENPDQPFERTFPLPGPLEVKKDGETLSFYHKLLQKVELSESFKNHDIQSLRSYIRVHESPSSKHCSDDKRVPLDLSPLLASLNQSGAFTALKKLGVL